MSAVVSAALRTGMAMYEATLLPRASRRRVTRPVRVLVTMTTHSNAWAQAHLRPMAKSTECGGVTAVVVAPLEPIDGVTMIRPPRLLMRVAGEVPARLLTFAWTALRQRPDVVGGFHLQMNGLAATWVARLIGSRSAYFCVGGPREVVGGGAGSENRLFGRLTSPDSTLERRLINAIQATDLVITMGTGALAYFGARGLEDRCHVVSGGIDTERFRPSPAPADLDLVFVGRLAPIKRVDLFLRAVRELARTRPDVRAAIVGDGPLRGELEALASELGIAQHVVFAGRQDNVAPWLQRARIFMLTSESEGLALSLMEAMCCGVAPVVANVGDLADLVRDGESGCLVRERTPEAFAGAALSLLQDPARLAAVRAAALRAAEACTVRAATERWNTIFSAIRQERS